MFNLKPIALVGGSVVCAVGFLLFVPLLTEVIYKTESWQSYAVPILLYLIVGGALVITNRNVELKISIKEALVSDSTSVYWIIKSIEKDLHRIRSHTDLPIAVGFGIKTPEQAREISVYADAVVVGSAFVNKISECLDIDGKVIDDCVISVVDLVKDIKCGLNN